MATSFHIIQYREKNDVQHNEDEQVRVYDKNDEFIGVYRFEGNEFVPVKMFYQP